MNQSAIIISAVGLTIIAGGMYLFRQKEDVTQKTLREIGNTREAQELRQEYQQNKAFDYDPNAKTFGGKKRKTMIIRKRKSQTKRKTI